MAVANMDTVSDINLLAKYLSDQQVKELSTSPPVDCIFFCASAILYQAEVLFRILQQRPSLTKTLVLCGGIGHSTQYIYDAVAQHTRFSSIFHEIKGLPEARVLEKILTHFFDRSALAREGCHILIEDQSTNCGQNAALSRRVLDCAGLKSPETCIIIQDPTMMLRTSASFRQTYSDLPVPPLFISCPIFVPQMQMGEGARLEYQNLSPPIALWPQGRFLSLIMGEIPRLRDDKMGYGPRGQGFIPHIDVPIQIEAAWTRLRAILNPDTRTGNIK